jgi:excisionase family DNA binding protein
MKRPAPHDDEPSPSLSLAQLARRWHVPRREVRRLLQQGTLPFEEIRGRLRVPLDSVHQYEETSQPAGGSESGPETE